jgi:hypothetical protein
MGEAALERVKKGSGHYRRGRAAAVCAHQEWICIFVDQVLLSDVEITCQADAACGGN